MRFFFPTTVSHLNVNILTLWLCFLNVTGWLRICCTRSTRDSTDEVTQRARDRADALVADFAPNLQSPGDMRCIEERQLRHKAGKTVAVSPHCRHGFPQAFAFDPAGHKISSGLFRLSCPFLVQAIDQLEDEGGVEDMNRRLEADEELREVGRLQQQESRLMRIPPDSPSTLTFGLGLLFAPSVNMIRVHLARVPEPFRV